MKSLLLFAMALFFATGAYAQDRTATGGESSSYKRKVKIDALDFFETLVNQNPKHPANKRNPNWPDQLTIEPIESISQKDFEEQLIGVWQVAYHCEGRPVLTNKRLYDGKEDGKYLHVAYDGSSFIKNEVGPSETNKLSSRNYSIKSLGEGRFELVYNSGMKDVLSFTRIKETGQFALLTEELHINEKCPNGKPIQMFEIRQNQNLM